MRTSHTEYEQPRLTAAWVSPLLRWAGSKRKLLPSLLGYAPPAFDRYIEPFAGSACLFFAIHPRRAILGDINTELLTTYDTIRSHPILVARAAAAWKNTKTEYYRVRSLDPQGLTPIQFAARFVYLNRYSFNGVYRTNRQGHFNVPRGVRTGSMPSETLFRRCAIALRNAKLLSGDFEKCVKDIRHNDFVYLDPPYASTNRPRHGEYGYGCFGDDDVERLVASLQRMDKKGAVFLLSYSDAPQIKSVIGKWHYKHIRTRRHVAGFAEHRVMVSEILVSNRPFPALHG